MHWKCSCGLKFSEHGDNNETGYKKALVHIFSKNQTESKKHIILGLFKNNGDIIYRVSTCV